MQRATAGEGRLWTAAGAAALLGLAAWPVAAAATGPEPDPGPSALCGDEGDALGHCGESDAGDDSDAGAADVGASDAGAGARDPGDPGDRGPGDEPGASDAGDRGAAGDPGGRGAPWPEGVEAHNPGDDFDGIDADSRHDAMVAGGCRIAAGAAGTGGAGSATGAPLVALLFLGAWLRRAALPRRALRRPLPRRVAAPRPEHADTMKG